MTPSSELVLCLRPARARIATALVVGLWSTSAVLLASVWIRFGALIPNGVDPARWLALWVGLLVALLTITVQVVRRRRSADRRILFRAECLELPRSPLSPGMRSVGYRDVVGLQRSTWLGFEQEIVAVRGSLPAAVWRRSFPSPEAFEQFGTALRARVGALPDGASRLRTFAARDAAADLLRNASAPVTWAVVAALAVVFALELALGAPGDADRLVALGVNSPRRLAGGELHRLVTASFLHLNGFHLAANAAGLLLLGRVLEKLLGSLRFGVVLGASALAGSAASALWLAPADASLGASTGVAGLAAAWVWIAIAFRDEIPARFRLPLGFWLAQAALLLFIEVSMPGLDRAAHVGGFAGGGLAMALAARGASLAGLRQARPRGLRLAGAVLLTLFASGLALGALHAARELPSIRPASAPLSAAPDRPAA